MKEAQRRTVENILHEGPPLEWYAGGGTVDRGIVAIGYSDTLRAAFGGELSKYFSAWYHIGVTLHTFGVPEKQEDKFDAIIEEKHELGRKVYEISGFWPEEISTKCEALTIIFKGQKCAPFEFTLIEPDECEIREDT